MRTPEQGHEAICLAHAMICAIENARDAFIDDAQRILGNTIAADFEFRTFAQDNTALVWADGYLADGTVTCICEPIENSETFDRDHFHFMFRMDVACETLTHCPSICDCPIDECDATIAGVSKEGWV